MKAYIEKTPYHQYLYTIWQYKTTYYIRQEQNREAYQNLKDMKDYATAHNDLMGIAKVYNSLGVLYKDTRNHKEALYNFKKAYEATVKMGDEKNLFKQEENIGICYNTINDYEQATSWLEKAVKHAPEIRRLSPLTAYIICAQRTAGYTKEDCDKDILEMKRLYAKYPPTTTAAYSNYHCVLADYLSKRNCLEQAVAQADSIKDSYSKIQTLAFVYQNTGQSDSAVVYLNKLIAIERQKWQESNNKIMAKLTTANDSSGLALHAQQLQIAQLKDKEQLLLMQSQQDQLKLRNGNLELANRQNLLLAEQRKSALAVAENRTNQLELQHQKDTNRGLLLEREQNELWRQGLFAFLTLMGSCAVFIYLHMKKSNRRLRREKMVTEEARKKEEAQRHLAEEAMNKAKNADKLKTLFLQNMSHEIRTPLNAIVGFNELLNGESGDELCPEERKEFLELIESNTTLLTTLINDILDLSKLESGTYKLVLTEVDVERICRSSITSVQGRNHEGVKLVCTPQPFPIRLHTDPARLQQILINFLTNACKNTEVGSITLSYAPVTVNNQSYVRFAVTDTGCGVPQEMANRVFERFEKLDNFKQGTGLGLSIVALISDLLQGRVYLDTDYTEGARFVFEHPITYQ